MIRRLFIDHLESVGERYGEHAGVAARFGVELIAGGVACLVHAVVPGVFTHTGSDTVRRLHARMTVRRKVVNPATEQAEWQMSYVI